MASLWNSASPEQQYQEKLIQDIIAYPLARTTWHSSFRESLADADMYDLECTRFLFQVLHNQYCYPFNKAIGEKDWSLIKLLARHSNLLIMYREMLTQDDHLEDVVEVLRQHFDVAQEASGHHPSLERHIYAEDRWIRGGHPSNYLSNLPMVTAVQNHPEQVDELFDYLHERGVESMTYDSLRDHLNGGVLRDGLL